MALPSIHSASVVSLEFLLVFSTAVVTSQPLSAQNVARDGRETQEQKKEEQKKLEERDRYAEETSRLRRGGKPLEALAACERMLAIERELYGNVHEDVAGSLEQLAELHELLEKFEAAKKCRKEVVAVLRQLFGEKNWRVADARRALRDLERRETLSPEQRRSYAEAQLLNGRVYDLWRRGRSREALPLAQRALETFENLLGKDHPETARALLNLGAQYVALARYREAEVVYKQAIERWGRVLGERHPLYATGLDNLAGVYQAIGAYQRALGLCRKALEVRRGALGEHHPSYANNLNNLAALYKTIGAYVRAEPLYKQSLEIWARTSGEESPDYGRGTSNLAVLYMAMGRYVEAEALLEKALEITKKVHEEEHPANVTMLNNLGDLYSRVGKYELSEPLLKRALELREKLVGKQHPHYALGLNNLAGLYQGMGKYRQAEELFNEAALVWKATLGEKHMRYGTSLNNLGLLYEQMGDYTRAEELCRRAVEIRKAALGEEHHEYAQSLVNQAGLYQRTGNYGAAENLLKRALGILRTAVGPEHPGYATSLNTLATLYRHTGDYARAEPLYRESVKIFGKVFGERHPETALAASNLAGLHRDMGDYRRARPLLESALKICEETVGREHPHYGTILDNLAGLLEESGEVSEAKPLYEAALEIQRRAFGREHPSYLTALNNLAGLHSEMGELDRAEPLLRKALEIANRVAKENQPLRATLLHNLAVLHSRRGEPERAAPLFDKVVEIRRRSLGERHPDYALTLFNRARMEAEAGRYGKAEPLLSKALEIYRDHLERVATVQSERQQTESLRKVRESLCLHFSLTSVAPEYAETSYRLALSWKGTVFSRQQRMRLARGQPELTVLFEDLQRTTSRLGALALSSRDGRGGDFWRSELERLTSRREDLERRLAGKSGDYRSHVEALLRGPGDLRSRLPREAVLVDFIGYHRHLSSPESEKPRRDGDKRNRSKPYHVQAYVLRRERPLVVVDLGPYAPIEKAIDAWRSALGVRTSAPPGEGDDAKAHPDPLAELDDAGSELRRRLWKPLEQAVSGARLILVSPESALGRFPLAALPGTKRGTYLVEEVAIALVPVPRLLPELIGTSKDDAARDGGTLADSLLLVGDVDFDADPPGKPASTGELLAGVDRAEKSAPLPPGAGRPARWQRLPATRGEILMVADTFGDVYPDAPIRKLRRDKATETAVAEEVGRHRFVHLATHGFFASLPGDPEAPAAAPSGHPADSIGTWHPGLLSGIVLAGANGPPRSGDDGILTALELSGVDFSKTELLVLSACETGLGPSAGGEGLLGLQRAAQMAGARATLATLWQVDDQDAQALVARFYENLWRRGLPKAEALRQAQLALMRGQIGRGPGALERAPPTEGEFRAHPRAWAAWVLAGDWR